MAKKRKARAKTPANAANSTERHRVQLEKFDLASRLAESLYTTPPARRLGFMQELIRGAREGEAPKVREVLTCPVFLFPDRDRTALFIRGCPDAYKTIAEAANAYCRTFWGASVIDVVKGLTPEPETGEVFEMSLAA
ncbi:hypothetical protein [Candidatus Rhodobacter oscarellae]|uniref:hypothetical protein n=1 Tax=Candidatus Rhodobacter oscarellae TaxID=1675527 RepID=UPI00128F4115|nr:hypothetical protein [Candidatus Rhodobacter lobularis]